MKRFMSSLVVLSIAMLMGACAGKQGDPGGLVITGTSPVVQVSNPVTNVVDTYNAYRESLGQDPISQGLACTLYTVPATTTSILATPASAFSTAGWSSVGSWTYYGAFNQANQPGSAGFDILPAPLQPLYLTYFEVHCTGYIVIPTSGFHSFTVSSDDGANLYIDGGLPLVNNDGIHGIQTTSAAKNLQATVHSFQIDYFQGPGNEALIVDMDGGLLGSGNLWH